MNGEKFSGGGECLESSYFCGAELRKRGSSRRRKKKVQNQGESEDAEKKRIRRHRHRQRRQQLQILTEENEELLARLEENEDEKVKLSKKNEELQIEGVRLREDVALLKSLVFRLSAQLEKSHDGSKTCNRRSTVSARMSTNSHETLKFSTKETGTGRFEEARKMAKSWGRVDVHALAPLLDAYQEGLQEKEQIIERYKQEMEDFGTRCQEIVSENEEMRKILDELKDQHEKKSEQVEKTREKQYGELEKQNATCKNELHQLRLERDILYDTLKKTQNNVDKTMPIIVHQATIDECKTLFDELKSQYESEKKKLYARLQVFEKNQPDTEKKLAALSAERDQFKLQMKTLEKTLKRTTHKLEGTQNLVYSAQISRDSFKRQLSRVTEFCQRLVQEHEFLEAEKDEAFRKIEALKSQLELFKNVRKETHGQLAEKKFKMQSGLGADRVKAEHRRQLQRLDKLLRLKDELIGRLENTAVAVNEKQIKDAIAKSHFPPKN